jgi:hypothetical protein
LVFGEVDEVERIGDQGGVGQHGVEVELAATGLCAGPGAPYALGCHEQIADSE